mmetsp:Transcript_1222/g.3820  ORF Transcript_1222/g.3820 Transcript_1222/m.3820 type:complete len:207 (-) Transcript_1222:1182-1802(-)
MRPRGRWRGGRREQRGGGRRGGPRGSRAAGRVAWRRRCRRCGVLRGPDRNGSLDTHHAPFARFHRPPSRGCSARRAPRAHCRREGGGARLGVRAAYVRQRRVHAPGHHLPVHVHAPSGSARGRRCAHPPAQLPFGALLVGARAPSHGGDAGWLLRLGQEAGVVVPGCAQEGRGGGPTPAACVAAPTRDAHRRHARGPVPAALRAAG